MKRQNIIVSLGTLFGLMLMPHLALAANTGTVTWVRTCSDGGTGQKVVFRFVDAGGASRTVYLGIQDAGSSSLSSIPMSALLSGRTVTVEHSSNATTQCGIPALTANGTAQYVQIN